MNRWMLLVSLAACGTSPRPSPEPTAPPPPVTPTPAPAPASVVDCNMVMTHLRSAYAHQDPKIDVNADMFAAGLAECQAEVAKDAKDRTLLCLTAAPDDATTLACIPRTEPAPEHQARQPEAIHQLGVLQNLASSQYKLDGAFPKGTARLVPEAPCCGQPDNRCPFSKGWHDDPVWRALAFQIDKPNLFQYRYTSDGKTFHAEAIGDLDCDGIYMTYKLDGSVVNGTPVAALTEPAPGAD